MVNKRLRGRTVVVSLLGLIALLLALVVKLWWGGRVPEGPIRAIAAVSDTDVVLLREGYRQHDFVHLTVRGMDGVQRWSVPFHDVPRTARPVVAADRVVTWVRNHVGELELQAFDARTGQFAFRAAKVPVPAGLQPTVDLVAIGDAVLGSSAVDSMRVVVVDARTGTERASHPLGEGRTAPRLGVVGFAAEFAVPGGTTYRLDSRGGALFPLPEGFLGGVVADTSLGNGIACGRGLPSCLAASVEGRSAPIVAVARRGNLIFGAVGTSYAALDGSTGRLIAHVGPAQFEASPSPTALPPPPAGRGAVPR